MGRVQFCSRTAIVSRLISGSSLLLTQNLHHHFLFSLWDQTVPHVRPSLTFRGKLASELITITIFSKPLTALDIFQMKYSIVHVH